MVVSSGQLTPGPGPHGGPARNQPIADLLAALPSSQSGSVERAWEMARSGLRGSDDPGDHGPAVARILHSLRLDEETLIAALLTP